MGLANRDQRSGHIINDWGGTSMKILGLRLLPLLAGFKIGNRWILMDSGQWDGGSLTRKRGIGVRILTDSCLGSMQEYVI